jgi:hypothetical protein
MLIANRFQSINHEKDGGTVRGIFNLKNEVKIITSPDETFELWKEFLEKHSTGGLINPDMLARFNQAKNFKVTKNFINCTTQPQSGWSPERRSLSFCKS